MKKFFYVLTFLSLGLIVSCSKDDGSDSSGHSTSYTVTADYTTRLVGETVTLTMKTPLNQDVTSSTAFYVNDQLITGNTFTKAVSGNYVVKGIYSEQYTSPTITVEYHPLATPVTSVSIIPDKPYTEVGEQVVFRLVGDNGQDFTSNATVYVNSNAVSGGSFSSNTPSVVDVYGTYNNNGTILTAPTIQYNINQAYNFNRRVLIEDFTGTWCGYCPRIAQAISQVNAQTSDDVVVSIHRGNDPYSFSGASTLESMINLQGYPTGMLNRKTEWNYPETSPTSIAQAVNLTSGQSKLGLAMTSSVSGSSASLSVNVKFGKAFANLKLVVYVLEDDLVHDQTNYTSYYGGGSIISNFHHDHVLRDVLTNDILGDQITGNTNSGDVFTRSFTYNIPGNVNPSNVRFVAFVVDSNGKTINARQALDNENQTFELE